MAIQSISYGNKTDLNTTSVPDTNKIKASDLNEIKSVVNNNASELTNVQTKATNLTPVVLYQDSTGTTGNVSLLDSPSNYSFIEIIFRKSLHEMCGSAKIDMDDGYGVLMSMIDYASVSIFQIEAESVSISGSTITRGTTRYVNFDYSVGNYTSATETGFKILKVIGYK